MMDGFVKGRITAGIKTLKETQQKHKNKHSDLFDCFVQ
jgi:hypothetical protein